VGRLPRWGLLIELFKLRWHTQCSLGLRGRSGQPASPQRMVQVSWSKEAPIVLPWLVIFTIAYACGRCQTKPGLRLTAYDERRLCLLEPERAQAQDIEAHSAHLHRHRRYADRACG